MKKQTAGRDSLGELAPKFAELNDDVLFGEVWARDDLSCHPFCIHAEYLFFKITGCFPLSFLDDLWFKVSISIPGYS